MLTAAWKSAVRWYQVAHPEKRKREEFLKVYKVYEVYKVQKVYESDFIPFGERYG